MKRRTVETCNECVEKRNLADTYCKARERWENW